ncbi:hypothetical protein BJX63DRAFT_435214 [Aspergillus granulosus]|uniref:F-box domain-containing protein n=1 Tax=Aspergillus granulosus TaxID=176169 RepID=A0ABR4H2B3_9EURO
MAHPRLSTLPAPLLTDIFSYVLKDSDYLPLLLISRHLRGVAEDVIYRDIIENLLHVPDPCRRLHLLFRTLFDRRDLASRVRSLTIKCARDILSPPIQSGAVEEHFIRELQLPGPDGWLKGCEDNFPEAYITLLMLVTPNLLHLKIESGYMSQAFPDTFHPVALASFPEGRRFRSLRSLTYGAGKSQRALDMTPFSSVVPFFYLPSLKELNLTGLFGRFHGWIDDEKPTTKIEHLSLCGFALDMEHVEEVLTACPRLITISVGAKYKPSSIFRAYGNLGRALLRVRSTIEEIDISYGEGVGFEQINPSTPHPHINEKMCTLADFPCLVDIRIPLVPYLGAVPQEALDLERFLPKRLETLRFYDDIWAVDAEENAELYWSTLFHRLHRLLSNKFLPALYEVNFFIQESAGWVDFQEGIEGLQEIADPIGIAIRYWEVAHDQQYDE